MFSFGDSKKSFAKLVIQRLRERGWQAAATFDSDRFAVALEGGTVLFLQTVYKEWCQLPKSEGKAHVDRVADQAFEGETSDDFDAVAPMLLPVLRNRCQFQNQWRDAALAMDHDPYAGACRPFCGGLTIALAVDRPTSIAIPMADVQAKWSRSFDEALLTAIDNLRARSPSRFERQEGGFFTSDYGDFYDVSRLLLPELFEILPLKGDPIAIPISRAGLVVAGSEDHHALDAMAAFVEAQIENETRPISSAPLILRAGEWWPYEADGLASLDRLRVLQNLRNHKLQKELLEEQFERESRDVFVASLMGIKDGDRIRTLATWTSETISLLPRADALAIRVGEESRVRHWSDVEAACGPLTEEPGHYPPRYFVETGPGRETWDRLAPCEHPAWLASKA